MKLYIRYVFYDNMTVMYIGQNEQEVENKMREEMDGCNVEYQSTTIEINSPTDVVVVDGIMQSASLGGAARAPKNNT